MTISPQTHSFLLGKKIELWMGAFKREREGNWIWSDCQPWKWANWDSTYYWQEQPNNYGGNENCALLSWWCSDCQGKESFLSSGTMCLACSKSAKFVCSKKICDNATTTTPSPKNTGTHITSPFLMRYKFALQDSPL